MVIMSHILCNGEKTKPVLTECDYLVVFRKTPRAHVRKVLINFFSVVDPKEYKPILSNRSRWLLIGKEPTYYLTSDMASLIG